jgi:hypothetical protein
MKRSEKEIATLIQTKWNGKEIERNDLTVLGPIYSFHSLHDAQQARNLHHPPRNILIGDDGTYWLLRPTAARMILKEGFEWAE